MTNSADNHEIWELKYEPDYAIVFLLWGGGV